MVRFFLAFLLLTSAAFAQSESVFMLNGPYGQGSAVLVHKCEDRADKDGNCLSLAATAYHVLTVPDDKPLAERQLLGSPVFEGVFSNKQISKRISYAIGNRQIDLALVWLIAPKTAPAIPIADTDKLLPLVDDEFEPRLESAKLAVFLGYASGKFKETRGRTSFRHEGIIQSDAIVIPGQSGGAMLVEGKLTGIISGGMDWFTNKEKPTVTWPARCADAARIKPMIEEALKTLPPK